VVGAKELFCKEFPVPESVFPNPVPSPKLKVLGGVVVVPGVVVWGRGEPVTELLKGLKSPVGLWGVDVLKSPVAGVLVVGTPTPEEVGEAGETPGALSWAMASPGPMMSEIISRVFIRSSNTLSLMQPLCLFEAKFESQG